MVTFCPELSYKVAKVIGINQDQSAKVQVLRRPQPLHEDWEMEEGGAEALDEEDAEQMEPNIFHLGLADLASESAKYRILPAPV